MTNISDAQVRDLYAAASHYDVGHLRRELNGAEFDAWLVTHDAALRRRVLSETLGAINEKIEHPDSRQWDVIRMIEERRDAESAGER